MGKKETEVSVPQQGDRGSLYARINAVKAAVKRIKKTGKNQHFGYAFATESDISDGLRELMDQCGVCLLYHGPEPEKVVVEDGGITRAGQPKFRARVWIRYELINVDRPEEREVVWGYGEALDGEDKGHNKAITNCHKYVMMKVFDISTGDTEDDPDSHGHADTKVTAPPKTTRTPLPPRALPAPEQAPMGLDGASQLLAKMNERGITLKDVRAGLYRRGLKDVLKGKEVYPESWPVGMIDDIKGVLEAYPVKDRPKSTEDALKMAAVVAWNKQSMSYKFGDPLPPTGPSYSSDPEDLIKKMYESPDWATIKDPEEKARKMISDLNGDLLDVLTGSMIPF